MSEIPDQYQTTPDHSAVVDKALIGAVTCSAIGGVAVGMASALLGGSGAVLARQYAGVGATIGGSVGVALSCFILLWVLVQRLKLWSTLSCLLAGALSAAALDWWIGNQFEWPNFRWALGGATAGTFLGALFGAIYFAKGGPMAEAGAVARAEEAIVLAVLHGLAAIIKSIDQNVVGTVLAGVIGGVIGGLITSAAARAVGGSELVRLVGSEWAVPVFGATVGAVGGGGGGLWAWALRGCLDHPPVEGNGDQGRG